MTGSGINEVARDPNLVLLIDLDDTLTDRATTFQIWASRFLEDFGLPSRMVDTLVELDKRGTRPRPEFLEMTARAVGIDFDRAAELQRYRQITGRPERFAGVIETLIRIRDENGVVILLSNGESDVQRRKLKSAELLESLDFIVISSEVGASKPDPQIFHYALSFSPSMTNAWMVGDNFDLDIVGAKSVGLRTAWVAHGQAAPDGAPAADIVGQSTVSCLNAIIEWQTAHS